MLVRNPQAPRGLFDGIAFDGSMAGEYRGSTYYHDASGYGHHGTLTNMDPATDWVWSPELNRWALDFDGSNDYVTFGGLSWDVHYESYTFSLWCRASSGISRYDTAFGQCTDAGLGFRLWTADSSSHKWSWDGGSGSGVVAGSVIPVGEWQHIICEFRNTGAFAATIQLYLDAVSQGTANITPSVGDNNFQIGRHGATSRYFPMQVAGFLILNRLLSPPEIQWLAQPQNKLWVPWRRTVWPVASVATVPEGSGSASVVVSATGAGQRASIGSGVASLIVSAVVDGVRTSSGSGVASVAVSASGAGVRESSGAGSAAVVVSAVGAGARTSQGSGSVTVTVGATASGSRISQGSGTLSVVVSAVGDGYSPPLAVPEGSGTLTVTVSASASGARQSAGSGLASIAVDAVASGSRASFGSGIASIVATAAGVGRRQSSGGGTLSIAVSASGAGETPGLRVAGPYRVLAAKIHAAGAAEGAVFCGGARTGKIHTAGATAGKIA